MKSLVDSVIKPITLAELNTYEQLDRVVVESLEQALYRVTIEVAGQRYYLTEDTGKSLTRRNKLEILVLLKSIQVDELYLKHVSPYDEMIGLSEDGSENELLVPLGNLYSHQSDETYH